MSIYNIFTDGGSRGNPGPAASAFVVSADSGEEVFYKHKHLGFVTNNVAEYSALIMALDWIETNHKNISEVNFFSDSQLMVYQLNGKYKVKDANMKELYLSVKKLLNRISSLAPSLSLKFHYIPREQNRRADELVNIALDSN